ncbi:proline-rich protein 15-like protein isoform X2 [Coturnix japonica]|nr:proline-rich protein 15-like protein isoform X2 [Coturnix japonica]
MAEPHSWWKLTFLRKRQSTPKVLYDSPDIHASDGPEDPTPKGTKDFPARLEKMVEKNPKGKHVKVSNSGRFKEKKKIRATLADNPALCGDSERDEK